MVDLVEQLTNENEASHAILDQSENQELGANVFTAQNTFPVEMKPLVTNDRPRQVPVCLSSPSQTWSDCWFSKVQEVKVGSGVICSFFVELIYIVFLY